MKREGWEARKLGEVCETITKGTTPKTIGFNYTEFGINFIKVESISESGCFLVNNFAHISEDCHNSLLRSQLKERDFLFSIAGALGRTAIVDNSILPANTNQALAIIRLKDKSDLFLRYLQCYFKSERVKNYINSIKVGVAQMNLSLGQLKDFPIIIPPLSEQSRIVEELDQLSNIIEKKRQQLSELDNLAQSIFYDMFGDPVTNEKGWEVKPLKENVFEMFLGPFGSALKVDSYVEKEDSYCIVYEQKHAIQGTLDVMTHYINKDKYEALKRFEVKAGDFIMSCRGTIGKLYQLPQDSPLGIIHPSLMKIRIKESIYAPKYFEFMLIKVVANESTNGNCVQMAITAKELGNKKLPLPPLHLQQLFAQKIEAIEKEKELIKQSIKETEELFNSRMNYYFG